MKIKWQNCFVIFQSPKADCIGINSNPYTKIIILSLALILISGCSAVAPDETVTNSNNNNQIEDKDTSTKKCLPEQRNVDACIEIYQPVCGVVNVQCIKAPCDPAKETFSNSCKACANSLVSSYVEGEC